jgi:hypothetical protein
MKYVLYFPLLAVLLIAYNIIMMTSDVFTVNPVMFSIPLMANDSSFPVHVSEFMAMLAALLLYFEILKATRYSSGAIIDHALSMVVFVIFLVEFIVVPGAGTATFMILTLMALLDVVAGFTVTISTARRDIAFGGDHG